jgi:hypothetical protein
VLALRLGEEGDVEPHPLQAGEAYPHVADLAVHHRAEDFGVVPLPVGDDVRGAARGGGKAFGPALGLVALPLQPCVHGLARSGREPERAAFGDLLGVPLGHPV